MSARKRKDLVGSCPSETMLVKVLDGVEHIAVQGYKADGTITFWNQASEQLYGFSQEEALGTAIVELLFEPQLRDQEREILSHAVSSGKLSSSGELLVCGKDGRRIWIYANRIMITTPDGESEFFCFDVDITPLRQTQESLMESERRLRILSDNLPGGMTYQVMAGGDGLSRQFVYVSAGVEKLHELTAEAVLQDAMLIYDQILPEYRPIVAEREAQALATMTPFNAEVRVKLPSGAMRWSLFASAPHKNSDGNIVWNGIELDITDRKQLEDQLRQSEKMRVMGQMAGGLSHDFGNLLVGIVGYADVLAGSLPKDSELYEYAERILIAARNGAATTAKLSTFSRQSQFAMVPHDLHNLVAEAIELICHATGKRIDIKKRLEANVSAIRGDASEIQNALLNLAINARDAMPDGGTLTLVTRERVFQFPSHFWPDFEIPPGRYVELAVGDTGVGMDSAVMARLFEPFFTTKGVGVGTGLGLANVFACMKQHHGAIEVESKPGKGSTFRLLFPIDPTING